MKRTKEQRCWLAIRRAVLMIVAAFDTYFEVGQADKIESHP